MLLTYTKINMLTQLLFIALIIIIFMNIYVDTDVKSSLKEKFAIPYEKNLCNRCNNFYLGNRCLTPYCDRNLWWYNNFTPLPWGNVSRTPKWYFPPYSHIHSYIDGWY